MLLATGTDLWNFRVVQRWREAYLVLGPVVVAKMGWDRLDGILVPYFPNILSVVAPTARGMVELVCTFESEVAVFLVKVPPGFSLSDRTHKRWLSLEREDLLAEVENRMPTPLRWRTLRHQHVIGPPVCVRAPSTEEGLEYVGKIIAEYAPDARWPDCSKTQPMKPPSISVQ
ncbi:MAG: hypothetical protein IPI67_30250 [Myxococcales bacterium]|nr:hypothetical protein [Myxococcales bacterium]